MNFFICLQKHMNILYSFPTRSTWIFVNLLISKPKHTNTLLHIALGTHEQTSSFSTRNTRRNFLIFLQTYMNKLLHFPWEAHEKNSCVLHQKHINKYFFISYHAQEQTPFRTRNAWTNIFTLNQKHINKFHLPLERCEQTSSWPTRNTWTNLFISHQNKMNKVLHFLQETDN